MSNRRLACLLVGSLAGPAFAQDTPALLERLSMAMYKDALEKMAVALDSGDVLESAAQAAALDGRTIAFGEETLVPDPGLLAAVKEATVPQARGVARRVRAVAAELESVVGTAVVPDHALVERLRAEGTIPEGGRIRASVPALSIPDRIAQAIGGLLDWIGTVIDKILEWIRRLWPKSAGGEATTGTVTLTLVLVAAALCVLVILAMRTARRSRGAAAAPGETRRAGSPADQDPLSRESDEWERYARELAAAGRRREAVRAWYHAVLSTLFRAGLLEPRKGRTNWEHVASLAPELGWRASFADITRAFEREWYGRDDSTSEALAQCARLAGAILRSLRGGAPA